MYPAPNNRHVPTEEEEGCELCGFMKPDFREDEEYTDRNSLEMLGTAEGGDSSPYNSTFVQQETRRYENHARPFNVEDIGPVWLQEEIKRLFPETRNPGKFPC